MLPARDHLLPPDMDAWRHALHPRGRLLIIAPTRAACETIELALHAHVDTVLQREHGSVLRQWARDGKAFGIVAGTGTGKTLGLRMIAEEILQAPLQIGVVNREREATADTPQWNVVIVTTGIARRWLADDLISQRDTIAVDEIHQTSAELELCLALGKRAGCRFIWLSATVDPAVYRDYLRSDEVLQTSAFNPALKARVTVTARQPAEYLDDRTVRRFIAAKRGVAVFLPTRAEVERLGEELGNRFPQLATAFYHGGEPIRVLRPFLEGEVPKPYLIAMTAAGQSALNLPGLDTVVIYDARYGNVVERGRNVLHRLYLGANEILQMAGRVHGRVAGGEVVILSDRELDFAALTPGPPEFQLAGDAERVALTCAAIGVDATGLDLPVPLDQVAYRRAIARLTARGLVEEGRLTRYGRQVEALPVDRPWAELLVHASAEELPLVAGASGIDSLHRMTREERNLIGAIVPGSDHLTAYNLLAEAINSFSTIGEVNGLRRHLFDEVALSEWSERRGVLVKAIEDGALGMAAAYRALDADLPASVPVADTERQRRFIDLLARIQPFDVVIDEHTSDGQPVRISRSSVATDRGAIAGNLRYFADRSGTARASIEGTTIPFDLVRRYAVAGPSRVILTAHRQRQELGITRRLDYFGFQVSSGVDRIRGDIPREFLEPALDLLARALQHGDVDHPARSRIADAAERLDEYWRRSGGVLRNVSPDALLVLIRAQLDDVRSWQGFQQTPVHLDVNAIVPADERAHLDALPGSLHLRGDAARLAYEVRDGLPIARVYLREGQVRRLRPDELPVLDRVLTFAMRRRGDVLQSDTLAGLKQLVEASARTGQPEQPHGGAAGGKRRGPHGRPKGSGKPGHRRRR
ncbi:MAG TPA: DEAD/DEAH box helicase [Gemmatimonadales bacterium]